MFIGITGVPGVGKTTFVTALADHLGAQVALETADPVANPILEKFYREPDGQRRYALALQLFYLEDRARTLARMAAVGGAWVTDQVIYCDAEVFARGHHEEGRLTDSEWARYDARYREILAAPDFRVPDVLVHLWAPLPEVLERIRHRGRLGEATTDVAYWASLHNRDARFAAAYAHSPIISLDVRAYDLKRDPEAIVGLATRIRAAMHSSHMAAVR